MARKIITDDEILRLGEECREKLGVTILDNLDELEERQGQLLIQRTVALEIHNIQAMLALIKYNPSAPGYSVSKLVLSAEDACKLGYYSSAFRVLDCMVCLERSLYDMRDTGTEYIAKPEKKHKPTTLQAAVYGFMEAPYTEDSKIDRDRECGWDEKGVFNVFTESGDVAFLAWSMIPNCFENNAYITFRARFYLSGLEQCEPDNVKFKSNFDSDNFEFTIFVGDRSYALIYSRKDIAIYNIFDFEVLGFDCEKLDGSTFALNAIIKAEVEMIEYPEDDEWFDLEDDLE